jgi:hypothetical protein
MCREDMQQAKHSDYFEKAVIIEPPEPKVQLVGGIVRSAEFPGLSPMMVEGGMRCRETTSAGGAEIRRTYWHGLPATLTDEVEDEGNSFTRLQERPQ